MNIRYEVAAVSTGALIKTTTCVQQSLMTSEIMLDLHVAYVLILCLSVLALAPKLSYNTTVLGEIALFIRGF